MKSSVLDQLNELKYVPYHKTGFKILGEEQLENMFPSYESILRKIEMHRKTLEDMGNGIEDLDSQFNLMYDNVFSILGKRGSGKTSAIFTLRSILQNNNKSDLILPVVMPEVIPRECSMIGWVLSLLEETVDRLDRKLKSQEEPGNIFSDCSYDPRKTLRREYDEIKELCYSQFYNENSSNSFSSMIANSDRKTQNSFDFSRGLAHFWNSLKHAICKTQGIGKDGHSQEPLIYVFFDDVDLMPERVMDLFFTIIKYLSHPNLIVFVTADEELLYDVLENEMNERLGKYKELLTYGIASRETQNITKIPEIDEIRKLLKNKLLIMREMPKLYGDKILPPSSRYYLEVYDTCIKKGTFIERYSDDHRQITLKDFICRQLKDYLKENGLNQSDDFLHYQDNFINTYLLFFGETSRQLANECLIIEDFFGGVSKLTEKLSDKEIDEEGYLRNLFYRIYYFVYNTLNAYGHLDIGSSELREFVDQIVLYRPETWGIYIDYAALKHYIISHQGDKNSRFEDNKESIDDPVKVMKDSSLFFSLMFLVENIIWLEEKSGKIVPNHKRSMVHGQAELVELFDMSSKDDTSLLCRNRSDMKAFLFEYSYILERPEIIAGFSLKNSISVKTYIDAIPTLHKWREGKSLKYYNRRDPLWFQTIVKILFLHSENIYNIHKKDLPYYNIPQRVNRYDPFFKRMLRTFREDFVTNCLNSIQTEIDYVNKISKEELCGILERVLASNFILEKELEMQNNFEKIKTLSDLEDEINQLCQDRSIFEYSLGHLVKEGGIRALLVELQTNLQDTKMKLSSNFEAICYQLRERFITLCMKFSWYRITNIDTYTRVLSNNNIADNKRIKQEKDKTSYLVSSEQIEFLIKFFIGKAEMQYEWIDDMVFYHVPSEREIEELTDILEIYFDSDSDYSIGFDIVVLYEALRVFTGFYLRTFLCETAKPQKQNPYKEFYEVIKECLTINSQDDIAAIIRQYIRDGIMEYYNSYLFEEIKDG